MIKVHIHNSLIKLHIFNKFSLLNLPNKFWSYYHYLYNKIDLFNKTFNYFLKLCWLCQNELQKKAEKIRFLCKHQNFEILGKVVEKQKYINLINLTCQYYGIKSYSLIKIYKFYNFSVLFLSLMWILFLFLMFPNSLVQLIFNKNDLICIYRSTMVTKNLWIEKWNLNNMPNIK